jgi:Domain of unknown function (DUF4263)
MERAIRSASGEIAINRLFAIGDVSVFLSFKRGMERAIRAHSSEQVILQLHDEVYEPVKRATALSGDAILSALDAELGSTSFSLPTQSRAAIALLHDLLDQDAKERELQNALVNSGLLALTCKVIQEVAMKPNQGHPGMRMDLVLDPNNDDPVEIIELKRGSHLLLARQGKPTERLSQELKRAVNQIQNYGSRLVSDANATKSIELKHCIKIKEPELRLIAGRHLPDAGGYHLLSLEETAASDSTLQMQIYTWDGFLAELERSYTD